MSYAKIFGRSLRIFSVLSVVALQYGCSSSSPTEPDTTPTSAEVEFQLFRLIAGARADAGVGSDLGLDPDLSEVARSHSISMRDHGFFSHQGIAGDRVGDRLRAAGYQFRTAAENIAQVTNSPVPATVSHEMLMSSAPHQSNILNSRFELVGIGVARADKTYWVTQVFISR